MFICLYSLSVFAYSSTYFAIWYAAYYIQGCSTSIQGAVINPFESISHTIRVDINELCSSHLDGGEAPLPSRGFLRDPVHGLDIIKPCRGKVAIEVVGVLPGQHPCEVTVPRVRCRLLHVQHDRRHFFQIAFVGNDDPGRGVCECVRPWA